MEWVRDLALALNDSFNVMFDEWDLVGGMDLPSYMEGAIRNSDYILIICTPAYATKANKGRGGAGYEKMVITGEIASGLAGQSKFIPLLRNGPTELSLPTFLLGKLYIDFRDDLQFSSAIKKLTSYLQIPELRANAFTLGSLLAINLNVITEVPRQEEQLEQLRESMQSLAMALAIAPIETPGKPDLSNEQLFEQTAHLAHETKRTLVRKHGPRIGDPFWLGFISSLAGLSLQNQESATLADPLIAEIEHFAIRVRVPEKLVRTFTTGLASRDNVIVQNVTRSFIQATFSWMAASLDFGEPL